MELEPADDQKGQAERQGWAVEMGGPAGHQQPGLPELVEGMAQIRGLGHLRPSVHHMLPSLGRRNTE